MVRFWFGIACCTTSVFGLAASAAAQRATPVSPSADPTPQAATPEPAASATTPPEDDGSTVVVTARRVQERAQDVPISITIFSPTQIENRNIVLAGDLATYTPSLQANSRFGPENTSFAIRGFQQEGATSPSVGVYFADVIAPRAFSGTTLGNGAGPGNFFDLENVQVLKGPQGTLFGRNTTGGSILLVPQKPTATLGGYVEGSIGDYNLRRVQGVLNIPINDSIRLRLGIDRNSRDGYTRNHSGVGPADFNDVNYTALRASLVVDVAPTIENYTIASYSRSADHGFLPHLFACDPNATGFLRSRTAPLACAQIARQNARGDTIYDGENFLNDPYSRITQWQVINTTSWEATDLITIRNIISYSQYRNNTRSAIYGEDFIQTSPSAFGINAALPANTHFGLIQSIPAPGLDSAAESTFTEEFQVQGRMSDGRFIWQAGLYTEQSRPLGFAGASSATATFCPTTNVYDCVVAIPFVGSLSFRTTKASFQDYAAYAQATYKLTQKLSLTGGLRYTSDTVKTDERLLLLQTIPVAAAAQANPVGACGNSIVFGAAFVGANTNRTASQCDINTRQHGAKPTWLVDVDYKPVDAVLLYGKYSRGYRQGGVNVFVPGLPTYAPEKLDAYEVGVKIEFNGSAPGHLNIAGFYNDLTNQQLSLGAIPAPSNPNQTSVAGIINAGASRIKGIEVDALVRPFTGLTLEGGYTYLDAKLLSVVYPAPNALFSSFSTINLPGRPLTLSPPNKFSTTVTYRLPIDQRFGRLSAAMTFTHADSSHSSYADEMYTPVFGRDLGILPAQNLINLNINWSSVGNKPIDVSLFITNLTNNQFPISVFNGVQPFGFESQTSNQPRMIGGRLRYRFGD